VVVRSATGAGVCLRPMVAAVTRARCPLRLTAVVTDVAAQETARRLESWPGG
jgi:hypothetical protein